MLDIGFSILGDLTTDYTDRHGDNGEGVFQPPILRQWGKARQGALIRNEEFCVLLCLLDLRSIAKHGLWLKKSRRKAAPTVRS